MAEHRVASFGFERATAKQATFRSHDGMLGLGKKPERDGSKLAQSEAMQALPADLLIDGSERRRQRPQAEKQQVEHYSGKKKAHTDKNLVVINTGTRQVLYLGPTEPGKMHDKKMADQEQITYPPAATLGKDNGFQGYEPAGVITSQPKKKPKGGQLTAEEKFLNRIISGFRILVENVIAGVKRCRIVKDVFRNTKEGFSDLAIEVACGLHNLRVACRHPVLTLDLLDLCT
jgi:hypothetical protein